MAKGMNPAKVQKVNEALSSTKDKLIEVSRTNIDVITETVKKTFLGMQSSGIDIYLEDLYEVINKMSNVLSGVVNGGQSASEVLDNLIKSYITSDENVAEAFGKNRS